MGNTGGKHGAEEGAREGGGSSSSSAAAGAAGRGKRRGSDKVSQLGLPLRNDKDVVIGSSRDDPAGGVTTSVAAEEEVVSMTVAPAGVVTLEEVAVVVDSGSAAQKGVQQYLQDKLENSSASSSLSSISSPAPLGHLPHRQATPRDPNAAVADEIAGETVRGKGPVGNNKASSTGATAGARAGAGHYNRGADSKGSGSGSKIRKGLVTAGALRDVGEIYDIDMSARLGHGHYGVVRKCTHRESCELRAIKMIKKSKVSRVETLRREIEILKCVDHPNIIKLHDVFEDDRYIHLITELCTGGELFDRIIEKTESEEGHYSEADASAVVKMILSGIEYCHNVHNISHRDLKPENFIFKSKGSESVIKIIDFGLSRFENEMNPMTTRVGTPYYIAPEVLTRRYDKACDLWSIGVVTYILLAGYPPFDGDTDAEIFNSVKNGAYDFPSPEWDVISEEAKDLIRGLLAKSPTLRLTATQALAHPWFSMAASSSTGHEGANLPPPVGADGSPWVGQHKGTQSHALLYESINRRLRRFVGMTELKKVALNVIAHDLQEAEIGHLGEMFTNLDEDCNGEISVEELEKLLAGTDTSVIGEDVVAILQGVDIDGSNTLDYREFLAATMERGLFEREENIRKAFAYFDLDGTGVITMDSLLNIFGSEVHARKIMGDVDVNSDGVIEYSEFKQMMLAQDKPFRVGR